MSTEFRKKDLKKKAFLQAYKDAYGNITEAAKAAGIDRKTYYNWKSKDEEFSEALQNIEPEEVFVDFCERALAKKVLDGDTTAIIFSLKTKGKKRGWIEKQEIEHSGELCIKVNVVSYGDYTKE